MGVIDGQLVEMESTIANAEAVKHSILQSMVNNEYLTDEQAVKFEQNFGIVAVKAVWYKKIFNYTDKSAWVYKCVDIS